MLSLLAQGEKPIDELARLTNQSLAAASANVKVLRNSHLISTDKRGRSMFCALADSRVAELWLRFRDLGEVIVPEIREVMREDFDADDSLSSLTEIELNEKLGGRGRFTLVDLRPATEYDQGHLPKARNMPFAELAAHVNALPKSSPMLVYCRGPFCAAALAGNRWLIDQHFKTQRLRLAAPSKMSHLDVFVRKNSNFSSLLRLPSVHATAWQIDRRRSVAYYYLRRDVDAILEFLATDVHTGGAFRSRAAQHHPGLRRRHQCS